MIPAAFEYHRAASVADALARLQAAGGAARLLAGGHSLVPMMKLRLSEPRVLIDIGRLPELTGIRLDGAVLEIGAATVHHDIATSPVVREHCPALADAAAAIGDAQVRHRGTIGGSLAHADPSADYPAAVLALEAEVRIVGLQGERTAPAAEFFRDLFAVDVAPDEMITAVRCRTAPASAYAKLHQRASHFAIVGVAAALEVRDGTIDGARVGVTGAGPCATRLRAVEDGLAGQAATAETFERVASVAGRELRDVSSDLHASDTYRRAMVPVFTRRALLAAHARVSPS